MEALARTDSATLVRERIACYPGAVRMPANAVELYIVRDFLTPKECAALIASIVADRVPSPVVSNDPVPSYRTSETCYLYAGPDDVTAVETKLDALTGLDPRYGEGMIILRCDHPVDRNAGIFGNHFVAEADRVRREASVRGDSGNLFGAGWTD